MKTKVGRARQQDKSSGIGQKGVTDLEGLGKCYNLLDVLMNIKPGSRNYAD
jgi:hypothetical protein